MKKNLRSGVVEKRLLMLVEMRRAERARHSYAHCGIRADHRPRNMCENDRSAPNVVLFRDVLDKAADLDLRPISAKRGSCSICNCIRARGGGSQMKEMRLVQHLLRVSVFLYSKQNKGTVCLVP